MNYFGWTLWTEFIMGHQDWLNSMQLGETKDFDPEEQELWDNIFKRLEDILDKSGLKNIVGGCYHISSEMGRIISDTQNFEIKEHYINAKRKFEKRIPLDMGYHAQFNERVNPLGNLYHKSFMEDIKNAIETECSSIVCHPPYNSSWNREKFTQLFIQDITSPDILEKLDKTDIVLCWENMIEGQYSSIKNLLRFRNLLKDELMIKGYPKLIKKHQFCLDTGHLLIWKHSHPKPESLEEELIDSLNKFAQNLKVYHIHANNGLMDNHITPKSLEFFEHKSRSGIKKDIFLKNSDEVVDWINICENKAELEGRHIHLETSTIPFSLNQTLEFAKHLVSLL